MSIPGSPIRGKMGTSERTLRKACEDYETIAEVAYQRQKEILELERKVDKFRRIATTLFYLAAGLHDDDSYYGRARNAPEILLEAQKVLQLKGGEKYLQDIGIDENEDS